MNFFDMGILEILLILVVALLIWGPGKIPEIARTLGKFMNILKKTSFDLTTQIRKEMEEADKEPPASSKPADSEKTDKSPDAEESGAPEKPGQQDS